MEEALNNNEDFSDNNFNQRNCNFKITLIMYIILGLIIIGLVIALILIIISKEEKTEEIIVPPPIIVNTDMDWNYFGEITYNISYSKNKMIENTFKNGGKNYDPEIGEINDGQNYPENERNKYDLYIPYSAMLNKDNYNGIILFVHGGSWIEGTKESFESHCKIYGEMGYITATMGSIKEELIAKGFNETNLGLALGGYSAGGHLILLYTYLMANSSIPLKFAIDICGPISVEPKHYYRLVKVNDTLESLDLTYIEQALKDNRIKRTNSEDTVLLQYMNAFLGERYNDSDLAEMLNENKTINYANEKFQKLYNSVKYSFPV